MAFVKLVLSPANSYLCWAIKEELKFKIMVITREATASLL